MDDQEAHARQELVSIRGALRLTQAAMAEAIGMPFRTYQALETGQNPVKPYHLRAARFAALEWVAPPDRPTECLPEDLVAFVTQLAQKLKAGRRA